MRRGTRGAHPWRRIGLRKVRQRLSWLMSSVAVVDPRVSLEQDSGLPLLREVRARNQAVKREPGPVPGPNFILPVDCRRGRISRSQSVILESDARSVAASKRRVGRGRHAKYLPNACTEQGAAMRSSVLRSNRAVLVSIEIMRAFIRLRGIRSSDADLARELVRAGKARRSGEAAAVNGLSRSVVSRVDSLPQLPRRAVWARPAE